MGRRSLCTGGQPYAKNIIHAARIAMTSRTSDAAAKMANACIIMTLLIERLDEAVGDP